MLFIIPVHSAWMCLASKNLSIFLVSRLRTNASSDVSKVIKDKESSLSCLH